jgi:hypothetical protein
LKKEILSDDFKKRKIFWKNIAENFLENFPYGKIFHLTSLVSVCCEKRLRVLSVVSVQSRAESPVFRFPTSIIKNKIVCIILTVVYIGKM